MIFYCLSKKTYFPQSLCNFHHNGALGNTPYGNGIPPEPNLWIVSSTHYTKPYIRSNVFCTTSNTLKFTPFCVCIT